MTWANEIQKNNVLQFKINELERTNTNLQSLVGAILTVTGTTTIPRELLNQRYTLHMFNTGTTTTISITSLAEENNV